MRAPQTRTTIGMATATAVLATTAAVASRPGPATGRQADRAPRRAHRRASPATTPGAHGDGAAHHQQDADGRRRRAGALAAGRCRLAKLSRPRPTTTRAAPT